MIRNRNHHIRSIDNSRKMEVGYTSEGQGASKDVFFPLIRRGGNRILDRSFPNLFIELPWCLVKKVCEPIYKYLQETNSTMNNIFHLSPKLLQGGADILPDNLGLLAKVVLSPLDKISSFGITSPLCRDVCDRGVWRDDSDLREERFVWLSSGFDVDMLDGSHLEVEVIFGEVRFE